VEKLDYAMSCFLLYLGTRKQYPALEHHTLILTERYKGLIADIFDRKIVPDDFSMYLHVPTRSDPSMAPEGCESMYVLVPVANLRGGQDWETLRQPFADRVIDFLEEWGMEGLRENLEVLHIMDPTDFRDDLNSLHGNAFAIVPKFMQTAYFRPHNRSEDVKGLYLVGAGTHPGAGVPGRLPLGRDHLRVHREGPGTPGPVGLERARAGGVGRTRGGPRGDGPHLTPQGATAGRAPRGRPSPPGDRGQDSARWTSRAARPPEARAPFSDACSR
jgi:phytoene desaturase